VIVDINEALRIMSRNVARAQRLMDSDTGHPAFCEVDNGTVSAIVEAWQALDEWLSRGGFLPTDWAR
jgi:hypothetical protein